MNYHTENYMWYTCGAMCLVPYDHYRKYDYIEFQYPKPLGIHDPDTAFKLGMAQCAGVPYETAAGILKHNENTG